MNSASRERGVPSIETGDVLLLDIEGTVCPISFVKDVLFPYAQNSYHEHLRKHWSSITKQDLDSIEILTNEDLKCGDTSLREIPKNRSDFDPIIEAVCQNFVSWTRQDKKYTILKKIQGEIYQDGFLQGILKANFFDDVIPAIKKAFDKGVKICIYSSGSLEAQKLLFAHTQEGDLSPFIHAYFDTTIGLKQESFSYSNICRSLDIVPERVLFLTDVEREAYAAADADVRSCLVVRPGNAPLGDKARRDFSLISSFDQIL